MRARLRSSMTRLPNYRAPALPDQGQCRNAICVIDRGDIPDQASGLRVESDNVGVERGHEYFVAEDGKSAIDAAATWPDVRRELTLVEPDRASSTSVESERAVVLAGGIEDAVHHQRRGFKFAGCGCLIYPFRDQRSS